MFMVGIRYAFNFMKHGRTHHGPEPRIKPDNRGIMAQAPAHIIDVDGEFSPFTLLKICKVFREMAAGDILEIRDCDPETRIHVIRILPADACRLTVEDPPVCRKAAADASASCRIQVFKTAIA